MKQARLRLHDVSIVVLLQAVVKASRCFMRRQECLQVITALILHDESTLKVCMWSWVRIQVVDKPLCMCTVIAEKFRHALEGQQNLIRE